MTLSGSRPSNVAVVWEIEVLNTAYFRDVWLELEPKWYSFRKAEIT